MNYQQPRTQPEAKAAKRIRLFMEGKGWFVVKLHGGKYQSGLPDFVAFHLRHGHRWIEIKAKNNKLNNRQREVFPEMAKHGEKIYVLKNETEYLMLFNEYDNWRDYR